MRLSTSRKLFDRSFSLLGFLSVAFLGAALLVVLIPIFFQGIQAFVFRATVEHRLMMFELFQRGNKEEIQAEINLTNRAREPVFRMLYVFKTELLSKTLLEQQKLSKSFSMVEEALHELFGPFPGESFPLLTRLEYGQTRWDSAQLKLNKLIFKETYDYSDPSKMGRKTVRLRSEDFKGTSLEGLFPYLKDNIENMLLPKTTFYWQFLTDVSKDSHFFGGIWPEITGTIYLTIGAMIFALPFGILAAIYLTEYSRQNWLNSLLRSFVNTLASVPSVVFGLFGLAFFINTLHVSQSKSVLAGSLTLALLILPTIIRASEEALLAVPKAYKEAALSLGASKWVMIVTVVLPVALPGILTGIIISMGRAAGETAPIIFTAAVSLGKPLKLWETFSQPTPALSWNIYNLSTEHQKIDELRHVQYGMVLTLVLIVLVLNFVATLIRRRFFRKLKG